MLRPDFYVVLWDRSNSSSLTLVELGFGSCCPFVEVMCEISIPQLAETEKFSASVNGPAEGKMLGWLLFDTQVAQLWLS